METAVLWPTDEWAEGELPPTRQARVDDLLEEMFDESGPLATAHAVVVIHEGRLVAERYGGDTTRDTSLISWSTAKSIGHAAVGILVRQGRLDPAAIAAVPRWHSSPDDPRAAITLEHLLTMR